MALKCPTSAAENTADTVLQNAVCMCCKKEGLYFQNQLFLPLCSATDCPDKSRLTPESCVESTRQQV